MYISPSFNNYQTMVIFKKTKFQFTKLIMDFMFTSKKWIEFTDKLGLREEK